MKFNRPLAVNFLTIDFIVFSLILIVWFMRDPKRLGHRIVLLITLSAGVLISLSSYLADKDTFMGTKDIITRVLFFLNMIMLLLWYIAGIGDEMKTTSVFIALGLIGLALAVFVFYAVVFPHYPLLNMITIPYLVLVFSLLVISYVYFDVLHSDK